MSRRRIAHAFDATKLLRAWLAMRSALGSPWLAVLTYHRVADPARGSLFDEGVIDTTPADLDRQLAFLRAHFDPITLDDLLAAAKGGRPLPKNPALVTFDDGYRDNHDVALPILRRHGVRAVFFIATSYIDERRIFWWDRINYVLKSTSRRRIALTYPGPITLELEGGDAHRARAILDALRVVKHSYGLELERFLAHLADEAGVHLARDEERRHADELLMTWDHLRHLVREGMAVQSHTVTHRVVQTLPKERLDEELRGSKAQLERELDAPVTAIAYPVGITLRSAPHVRAAVEAAGYSLGFTDGNGVNERRRFDPLAIARLSPDATLPDYQFRAMLALPFLRP